MFTISVNGNKLETKHETVKPVLDELQLTQGRYAVEINGELVPKSELDTTYIQPDMIIEVVHAVGGG